MSNTVASTGLSNFKARIRAQLTTGGGDSTSSVDELGTNSGELGVGITTIDVHGDNR